MKYFQKQLSISRRGAGILLAMSFLGFGITMIVIEYTSKAAGYYSSTRSFVDGYSARELSYAGLEAGILTLRSIPEEQLFSLGLISNPPKLLLSNFCTEGGKCTNHYVSYSIQPEDGKLNLNHLITNSDELNNSYHRIFSRLFEALDLDIDSIAAIIDWIDLNDFQTTNGAERAEYSSLEPSRKIKNGPMYSLSELSVVIGFDKNLVYSERIPANFQKEKDERASIGEIEEELIQSDDWVLANNLTAYLPEQLLGTEKVNLNAARYHVLYSLAENMGKQEVTALFKLRAEKVYVKDTKDIEALAELKQPSIINSTITLAKELLGEGSVSGFLKLKSRFYKITGIGYITLITDTEEKSIAVRRVWGIYDKDTKKLIYFSED